MTAVAPTLSPNPLFGNLGSYRSAVPSSTPSLQSPPRRPEPRRLLAGTAPARRGRPRRAVYWRRRLVIAVLGAGALVGLAGGAGAVLGGPATGGSRSPAITRYVVQPGDTLWKIARRLEPQHDPREVVDLLAGARHTTVVVPGEVIDWAGM
jgi:hypothetical protein